MTPDELRAMAAVMREVGAVQADGITLGPPPTRLDVLERQARETPELVDKEALETERRKRKLDEARQHIRDSIGNDALTDEECDRFIRADH